MDTSDICCKEQSPSCTEDVGGTWGRCVSQNTSESHSSVCTHNLIQHSTHDTNHVHTQGAFTALHWAAHGGSLECVEYLLPLFGERMFEEAEENTTCLHYAVAGGSLPVMRYLVDQCGFDLSLRAAVSCGVVYMTLSTHV